MAQAHDPYGCTPASADELAHEIRKGVLAVRALIESGHHASIYHHGGIDAERLGLALEWVGDRLRDQTDELIGITEVLTRDGCDQKVQP